MKILIVDDNPENLYMLESLLKGSGYEVAMAADGIEAIEKLKRAPFDMIISDILMPRMDGYDLCRACKQDEALSKTPFLLYTAVYTNVEDEEFAKSLGAARYIVKPIDPVDLLRIIKDVFKEYGEGKAVIPRRLTEQEEACLAEYSGRLVNQLEKKVKELENEIAARMHAEEGLRKSENEKELLIHDLKERVKELTALHHTAILIQNEKMSPADIFKEMTDFLPYAWQYPYITAVRVSYGNIEFKTSNYSATEWNQHVGFKTSDGVEGGLDIVYLEQRPQEAEGPFLAEERNLLNSLAEMLQAHLERKRAEEAFKESEAYIRLLIEQSPIALLVDVGVEASEKIIIMNRKFTELFGYTMEDVPDVRHWWPLAYPDEKYREEVRAEWIRRVEKAIQTHSEIEPMEATVTCKDGSIRYVRIGLASIGNRNIVTFEDLTERKQYEEALKDSIGRLRSITSAALDAIVLINHEGRIIFWNNRAEAMFGYTREEAEGKDLHILLAPERYHAAYSKGYEEFKRTGQGTVVGKVLEVEALRKDGTEFPVELSVAAVMLKGQWNSVGIIRDISSRRKVEETLREHYKFLQTLIDIMPSPLFYKNTEGVYLGCNRAFETFLGLTKTEIIGKTVYDIMQKDLADKYSEWDRALFEKPGVQAYESTVVNAAGKRLNVISNRATFNKGNGTIGGLVGIITDITESREAEKKMKEEMEATSSLLMIARATSTTTDINRLMESVVSCVHRIFGCNATLSYLWDSEVMEFVPSHAEGLTPGLASIFRGEPIGENIGFVKQVLTLKRNLTVSQPVNNLGIKTDALQPLKWLGGLRQFAVIPLIGRKECTGLLLLTYNYEKNFTERDNKILEGISHQVSIALEEARLYTDSVNKTLELSHNIEAMQVMHEIDRSILSTLNRDELLDTAVGFIDRVVPCDYVMAFLVDKGRGVLDAVAGNIADTPKRSLIPFADTLAADIIDTGRPQIIPDLAKIRNLPPFDAQLMEKGCRSSIRVPLTVKGEVSAVLFIGSNRKAVFTPEDFSMIEKLASQICVALENSRLLNDLNDLFIGIITSLSEAIDTKSPWTRGHSDRVTKFAIQIARELGINEKEIKTLEVAGHLHDIGKLGTYEKILEKPDKLTEEELMLMKQHPGKGVDILAPIKQLQDVLPIIKHHHEFYDGTGYPDGLKGADIPFMARILTVADSADAMGADRPYRKGMPIGEIVKELMRCSGTQFDPAVVEAFIKTLTTENIGVPKGI